MLDVKKLLTKILNLLPRQGRWTAQLYDYNTLKLSLPNQKYYKIGDLYIYFICAEWWRKDYGSITFNTMLQIRGYSGFCVGGNIFIRGSAGDAAKAIQPSDVGVYPRPNWTGTISASSNGIISGFFIGYNYVP